MKNTEPESEGYHELQKANSLMREVRAASFLNICNFCRLFGLLVCVFVCLCVYSKFFLVYFPVRFVAYSQTPIRLPAASTRPKGESSCKNTLKNYKDNLLVS